MLTGAWCLLRGGPSACFFVFFSPPLYQSEISGILGKSYFAWFTHRHARTSAWSIGVAEGLWPHYPQNILHGYSQGGWNLLLSAESPERQPKPIKPLTVHPFSVLHNPKIYHQGCIYICSKKTRLYIYPIESVSYSIVSVCSCNLCEHSLRTAGHERDSTVSAEYQSVCRSRTCCRLLAAFVVPKKSERMTTGWSHTFHYRSIDQ